MILKNKVYGSASSARQGAFRPDLVTRVEYESHDRAALPRRNLSRQGINLRGKIYLKINKNTNLQLFWFVDRVTGQFCS